MIKLTNTIGNTGYLVFDYNKTDACLGVIKIKKGIITYVAPLVEQMLKRVSATVYDLITIANFQKF